LKNPNTAQDILNANLLQLLNSSCLLIQFFLLVKNLCFKLTLHTLHCNSLQRRNRIKTFSLTPKGSLYLFVIFLHRRKIAQLQVKPLEAILQEVIVHLEILKVTNNVQHFLSWGMTEVGYLDFLIRCKFICRKLISFPLNFFSVDFLFLNNFIGFVNF
jgi:hypothetical protein